MTDFIEIICLLLRTSFITSKQCMCFAVALVLEADVDLVRAIQNKVYCAGSSHTPKSCRNIL